jgi:hypothetical protein
LNIHVDGGHDVVRNGRENIGERFGSARTTALASPFRLLKAAPKETSAARTSLSSVGMAGSESAARISAKEAAALAAKLEVASEQLLL